MPSAPSDLDGLYSSEEIIYESIDSRGALVGLVLSAGDAQEHEIHY
jgi:hypothetical protein